jgi:pSer/pThr/pTyr-binding forkhead associated (FHA) protein
MLAGGLMQNSLPLAWLINQTGTPEESKHVLLTSETILGRGPDCDIQLTDPLISRRHAAIYFRDTGFEIEDLNSSNGTFLNDQEIKTGALHDGDKILIGNTIFHFRIESDPDAAAT